MVHYGNSNQDYTWEKVIIVLDKLITFAIVGRCLCCVYHRWRNDENWSHHGEERV